MRIEDGNVWFTPYEAYFTEDSLMLADDLGAAKNTMRHIRYGIVDWMITIVPLPRPIYDSYRDPLIKAHAMNKWAPTDGEVISASLTLEQLRMVSECGETAVELAKEEACNVGADYDLGNLLMRALIPEDMIDEWIKEEDAEEIKSQLFAEKLDEIATGYRVIGVISQYIKGKQLGDGSTNEEGHGNYRDK